MRTFIIKTAFVLSAAVLVTVPALAESSASSAASDGVSASVGSFSTSIEKSSNSSSGGNKVAAGNYKVIDVAELAEKPGFMRVHLQGAVDGKTEFTLLLPRQAAERGHVVQGQIVTANARPYGLELATGGAAFFLVMDDDWHRELASHPV